MDFVAFVKMKVKSRLYEAVQAVYFSIALGITVPTERIHFPWNKNIKMAMSFPGHVIISALGIAIDNY